MKSKIKPESRMASGGAQEKDKTKTGARERFELGESLLKMNEFSLILLGALVVTVLVFFLLFRSPDPEEKQGGQAPDMDQEQAVHAVQDSDALEQRIASLELALSKIASSSGLENDRLKAGGTAVADLNERVTRLEGAMTLKLDTLIERLAMVEKNVDALKLNVKTAAKQVVPKVSVAAKTPSVKHAAKQVAVKKQSPTSSKKQNIFHTVKKGETLWSISQKYKTTVAAVRQLNHLTPKDKIYPGANLLVH